MMAAVIRMTPPVTLLGAQPRRSRRAVSAFRKVSTMARLQAASRGDLVGTDGGGRPRWTLHGHNGINPQPLLTVQCAGGNGMKFFFLRFVTWWNCQTFGTQVWTALYGEFVGSD